MKNIYRTIRTATLTILTSMMITLSLNAETVSREKASEIAQNFFGTSTALTFVRETPGSFVFNNPEGGWVIISSDDIATPVLAWSPEGSFGTKELPSNARIWFKTFEKNLKLMKSSKHPAGTKISNKWKELSNADITEVNSTSTSSARRTRVPMSKREATGAKELPTAPWGQGTPFNNLCPKYTGEAGRSASGCVATAMAIVLRYHQWPETGTGTIDQYTYNSKKLGGQSIDGKEYKWSNMPTNNATDTWTTAQNSAVADLVYDCGTMVQMSYSYEGSGACSSDIVPALAKHMSYDKSAVELYRMNYSDQEWFQMIKAEIDANRPIIYGGVDNLVDEKDAGGHQFVCDGYDASNRIHINWGWNGSYNGYYAVNYLGDKTDVQYVFSLYDSGIFGLCKAKGSTGGGCELMLSSDDGYYGISLLSGNITKGGSPKFKVGGLWNYSYTDDYSGAVKLAIVDSDFKVKEYISSETTFTAEKASSEGYLNGGSFSSISTNISCDVKLGDAVCLFYKNSDGSWLRAGGGHDFDYPTVDALGVVDVPIIRIPSTLEAGQYLYLDFIYGQKVVNKIAWYYDGTAKSETNVQVTSGTHTIKAVLTYSDSTTETVTRKFKVN